MLACLLGAAAATACGFLQLIVLGNVGVRCFATLVVMWAADLAADCACSCSLFPASSRFSCKPALKVAGRAVSCLHVQSNVCRGVICVWLLIAFFLVCVLCCIQPAVGVASCTVCSDVRKQRRVCALLWLLFRCVCLTTHVRVAQTACGVVLRVFHLVRDSDGVWFLWLCCYVWVLFYAIWQWMKLFVLKLFRNHCLPGTQLSARMRAEVLCAICSCWCLCDAYWVQ
jgi:hypothetical protein